jgi:hypothetical protein
MHLLGRSFEQPAAAHREQGVAHEDQLLGRQVKGYVPAVCAGTSSTWAVMPPS